MLASELKESVTHYYVRKRMAVSHEVGLCRGGRFRADVLALSMRGDVTVVEVKSSVADFRADKKWHEYQNFSNRLYFAVSQVTYEKVRDKIPKGIGIMVVDSPRRLRVVQPARYREIDAEVQFNLVVRMAFRSADFNRLKKRRVNK